MIEIPVHNQSGEQVSTLQVDEQILGSEVRPALLKQAYVRYHAHPKKPHSWRKGMPEKMRRLANRNALLAKLVDGEVKVVDGLSFDKPSTRQFNDLLKKLGIDRSCLFALQDVRTGTALSARNVDHVSLTQIDRLNAFDLLNHRYLLADRQALEDYLGRVQDRPVSSKQEAAR